MRRCLLITSLSGAVLAAAQSPVAVTATSYLSHVKVLSADDMGGRGNGTEGLERAARYIEQRFRAAGLTGGGERGSFAQRFEAEVRVEPPSTSSVVFRTAGFTRPLVLGRDFYPLSLLDRPPEEAPELGDARVVFAGYGISAPGIGYDDFAGLDVAGAAVIVFTHEPQEHDDRSVFDGRHLTPGAAIATKAREARERGARLLMVVEDPSHLEDRTMRGSWWADPQSENLGLPVVRVARDQIAGLLPGFDLAAIATRIDRTLAPASQALPAVTVSYAERRAQFTAPLRNVVGVLRGWNPSLARQAVVVGAHFDHVGTGGALSESPEATGEIHNGADDNASGTAALLELARVAGGSRARFGRTLVFVAFAGEELGLRGSEHYAEQPVIPLDGTVAMLNLDMVGRARGRLMVGVFGRSTKLASLVSRMKPWTSLQLQDFSKGGYAADASDGASFASRGVPTIAFFTGFHGDYHRPTDDWPRIDAEGGAEITRLALRLVEDLAR